MSPTLLWITSTKASASKVLQNVSEENRQEQASKCPLLLFAVNRGERTLNRLSSPVLVEFKMESSLVTEGSRNIIDIDSETEDEDNEEVSLVVSNQKTMVIRPKLNKNVQVEAAKVNHEPTTGVYSQDITRHTLHSHDDHKMEIVTPLIDEGGTKVDRNYEVSGSNNNSTAQIKKPKLTTASKLLQKVKKAEASELLGGKKVDQKLPMSSDEGNFKQISDPEMGRESADLLEQARFRAYGFC